MAQKPDKKETGKKEPEAKSGGGLAGLLIVAGASLASSFGLFYFLGAPPAGPASCPPASELAATASIPPLAKDQVYVELKEVIISIGSAPTTRYLKINLSVVTSKNGASAVKQAEPMLIDAFNNYLRSIELKDVEDPAFYPHLREQLSRRAELVLGSAVSNGVLITEFLLR